MELIPMDVCVLCDQNTAVLSSDSFTPYVKYMNDTFFDKDKLALERFQELTEDRKFCALCAHKIAVSHTFKGIYEETSKKRTANRKTQAACLLCESKSSALIQTDNNPNEFDTKIKPFMDSSLHPRPYIQCAICFECLFNLSVWNEINGYVVEKVNSKKSSKTEAQAASKSVKVMSSPRAKRTPNAKNDGVALKKDKENITPENSNHTMSRRSNPESESAIAASPQKQKPKPASVISKATKISNNRNTDKANKIKESEEEASKKFHMFLKETLKHLKSMEANMYKTELPQNVVEDKKMFQCIPYVLIAKDNEKTPLVEDNKKTPLVKNNNKTPLVKENKKQPPLAKDNKKPPLVKDNTETTPKKTKRNAFTKPQKLPKKPRLNLSSAPPVRRSTRSDKPIEVIELSDSESVTTKEPETVAIRIRIPKRKIKKSGKSPPITYNCNICDQAFDVNCDYKAHSLWHEKPEEIVINVARQDLSQSIKSHQSSPGKQLENSKLDIILQKYANFASTEDTFDSDCSNSNEIDKIIDTLNSEEPSENCDSSAKTATNENNIINSNHNDTKMDVGEEQASNTDSRHSPIESEIGNKETENIETVHSPSVESDTEIGNKETENAVHSPVESDTEIETKETEAVESETENETKESETVESETENETKETETEIGNKETENIEPIIDTESNPENDSRITEKTATMDDDTENTVDNNKEIEDIQPEQDVSNSSSINEQTENINDQELNNIDENLDNTASDTEENCIETRTSKIHEENENNSDDEQEIDNHEEETQDSNQSVNDSEEDDNDKDGNDLPNGKAIINNEDKINTDDSGSETDVENDKEKNNKLSTINNKISNNMDDSDSENDIEKERQENHNKISTLNENNFAIKRKRSMSVSVDDHKFEDSSSDTETVTPKAKKVRFAMDYQSPTPENEDNASDGIAEPEQDSDIINTSTEVQEPDEQNVVF